MYLTLLSSIYMWDVKWDSVNLLYLLVISFGSTGHGCDDSVSNVLISNSAWTKLLIIFHVYFCVENSLALDLKALVYEGLRPIHTVVCCWPDKIIFKALKFGKDWDLIWPTDVVEWFNAFVFKWIIELTKRRDETLL